MTYLDFVRETICDLDQPVFEELKQLLLPEYITFSIIDYENVTEEILAEKIFDYFCILEIKTRKSFDKYVEIYLNNLNTIVGPYIAKTPQARKGDEVPPVVPRSRKFYERAIEIKSVKNPSITELIDYTRIMMCLYTAAVNNEGKPVENFEYAASCLDPKIILESLRSGIIKAKIPHYNKKRFDIKEQYSSDVCTLIILILSLCSIVNRFSEGETVDD